jgi:hypothetical protein
MGDCRGLKSIYRSDPRKRQRGGDKDGDKNDRRGDKRPNEEDKTEEECDKDPRHAYKDRSVRSIFGGKVVLENERQRKLTARAIMALNNSNEEVADPKYQNCSHQPITFSIADQWANILKLGCFPLVLDPIIRNVWF